MLFSFLLSFFSSSLFPASTISIFVGCRLLPAFPGALADGSQQQQHVEDTYPVYLNKHKLPDVTENWIILRKPLLTILSI